METALCVGSKLYQNVPSQETEQHHYGEIKARELDLLMLSSQGRKKLCQTGFHNVKVLSEETCGWSPVIRKYTSSLVDNIWAITTTF